MGKYSRRIVAGLMGLLFVHGIVLAYPIDRIAAVVDDGVILESELYFKVESLRRTLLQSKTRLPPEDVLIKQVLERLIVDKLQLQMAERGGIKVDEETLHAAVQQIAQRNNMSLEQFRKSLASEGMDYGDFVEQIRNEITISRLRSSQVNSQIKVSDLEVRNYMETKDKSAGGAEEQYLLGHILIATPSAASSSEVQKAKEKAEKLLSEIRRGMDFKQAALSASDDEQALKGGDLGWRKKAEIPSLFAEYIDDMNEGDVVGPVHSSSGFHLIKLLGLKGKDGAEHRLTKTHARHILIKPNELINNDDARKKIVALRNRIEHGEDFATLAKGHSDDKGSAVKGGDLGWVQPGALVPAFESTMNALAIKQLSEPVQTQFGWHLIQVLERQESDDTVEYLKNQAREEIFRRKVDEETELWIRRLRDEAYVEIRLGQ
ncbi:molecular chaperone SurA [Candidatus Methylospira mobilis]|uniref:Chaperone SurA n=2 Tax=Candidatus Methylospira mobilis TaxID=1808979 RepID=A0A5Q0BDN5_9GAMM|nr:molecular chaperone SurA [Candidatus Methylospira mobilis]